MDSFPSGSSISKRENKRPTREDLRSMIASKKAGGLRTEYVGVIGAEYTGRNTLVRRFLHMSAGPFPETEEQKYTRRTILIDLTERPSILQAETVKLNIHILNGRTRSYEDLNNIIPSLKSIAMVFDVRNERTLNIAISCANRIRSRLGNVSPPFIMVGNKIDLPEIPANRMTIQMQAGSCGAQRYYECSARMNTNVNLVLDAVLIMSFFPDRPLPQ